MSMPAAAIHHDPADGRVVVLGSLNVDIVARVHRHPAPGETVLGRGGDARPGGKGANQAVAAALTGATVHMIGAVGQDAHAEVALSGLRRTGCDVSGVRAVAGPTGLALIAVSDDGENSIIVVPGANAAVGEAELSRLADLHPGDVLVLQGEVPVPAIAGAMAAAETAGCRVVLNLAPVVDVAPEVLRCADPLVVNEHEALGALRALGAPVPGPTVADQVGEATRFARALLGAGVRSVVVTLGGAGALVGASAAPLTHVPAERVRPVDTTGAGDGFTGALAACLARGIPMEAAAQTATHFAAQAVCREGAQESYPGWETILS